MIFLIKALYVRQVILLKNKNLKNVILNETEMQKYTITKETDLTDFYFKYDQSFSDHIVMDVVLKMFFFVQSFGSQVVKYENFLMEKNENI